MSKTKEKPSKSKLEEFYEYREELFDELGFTPKEAAKLARARRADGTFVRPDWVQRHLLDHKVGHKMTVYLLEGD